MLVEELEPRILYSADAAALLGLSGVPGSAQVRQFDPAPVLGSATATSAPVQQQSAREIVFIDSRVPDALQLADELMQQRGGDRVFDIVMLDGGEDGVEQINRILANEQGLSAIHIISHGSDGAIDIGNTRLDGARLAIDGAAVARWGQALAAGGDLLLYGCEVAQSAAGQAFVQDLARLTGADVAASSDVTGSVDIGGNWTLEYATGQVHTQFTPSTFERLQWQGVLVTFTVTSTADTATAGTLRWAITQANSNGTGLDTINFSIAGAGVQTINVTSALPTITGAVVIDGWTQPGYTNAPLIQLNGAGAGANVSGLTLGAGSSGSTIRGLVINRFTNEGIDIGSDGNLIVGNYIGTDATGMAKLGNTNDGIQIANGANNTIGGTTAAERNIISGNGMGLRIAGSSTSGNIVIGNYIGADATGAATLGNTLYGMSFTPFAISGANLGNPHDNRVGGTAPGEGNLIVNNGNAGISLYNAPGIVGQAILGNSIYANGGLGIDLAANGVTANDLGDPDAGPNDLQNFAVLTSAGTDGGKVAVAGSLNTNANTTIRIEFFVTDVAAAGNGQGKTYIGATMVVTDGNGNARFVVAFNNAVAAGQYLTATATVVKAGGTYGSTSEFSANVQATSALIVDTFSDVVDGTTSSVAALLAGRGIDGKISLREAIIATNNTAGTETIYLAAGTYALTRTGTGEDLASTGDLDIRDSVTIIGAGAGATTISAGGIDRVFDLVVSGKELSLAGVTVTGGAAGSLSGGAIQVKTGTTATISDVIISGNTAASADGGAIANNGTLYLDRVRITGNSAQRGGGIYDTGTALVTNSLIDANAATTADGGGIRSSGGALTLVNVTVSGNSSAADGGGIWTWTQGITLQNVSITNNTANRGGGIHIGAGVSTNYIRNTIVAGNFQTGGGSPDVKGAFTSLGNNIIGDVTGGTGWVASDKQNVTPLLNALASNGGSTPTHSLQALSPAIDAGSATGAPVIDQRGNFRDASIDIGAFEYSNVAPTLGNGTLAPVAEDTASPSGQSVSTIFAGQFADPDPGSSFGGIAVVGNTANAGTQGTWQYSTNGGSNWFAIGSVTDGTSALALSSSTLIRFVPVANYNGTPPALVVRGLDNTYVAGYSSTAGSESRVNVNTASNGGSTAIAAATATLSTTITAVNDAPTLSNGATVTLSPTNENTASTGTQVTSILASVSWADVDAGAARGMAITSTSGGGAWQYSTNGTNWVEFGTVSSGNALLITATTQVRYVPNGLNGETATFAFRAWDQTTGAASTNAVPRYADPGVGGGTSAYSSGTATASISVSSINDAPTLVGWYDNNWSYRNEISIDHTKVAGNVDLTDFTVLINLSANADLAAGASSSGSDIRFTSADGTTLLAHEIETFTSANGALMAWVKLPTLSANVDTRIYMYYGNAAATAQAPASGVWDASTAAVYHLGETTSPYLDSSGNANNSTSGTTPTATSGWVGGGQDFDGSTTTIVIADSPTLNQSQNVTVSAWVKLDAYGNVDLVEKGGFGGYTLWLKNNVIWFGTQNAVANAWAVSTTPLSLGVWYAIDGVNNNGINSLYINGVLNASSWITSSFTNTGALQLGNGYDGYLNGVLDEVRVDTAARTAGWISTKYNNTASSTTFSMVGAQQAGTGATTRLAATDEDTPSAATSVNAILTNVSWADADIGAMKGIAVSAMTGNGTWQYSSDGVNWTAFGAVNSSNALLLDSATDIRYIPDGVSGETATFEFRAWDKTSGSASSSALPSYANPGAGGGTSAYSAQTATAAMTVTDINDAPTATNLNAAETYTEDTPLNLIDIVISDVDSANVTVTLTLSNIGAGSLNTGSSGSVTSTFSGGVWSASGATADVNALLAGLTFTPTLNFNGNFTIATSVSDGSLAVTGSKAITGIAVNDAPVANDDIASTSPGTAIDVNVKDNDSDVDNALDSLIVTILGSSAGTTATVNGDKSIHFDPGLTSGAQTVTYRLSDGSLTSNVATLTINVAANTPPDSADASATFNEDTSYVFKSSDFAFSDADSGQTLAGVRIDTLPASGTLLLNGVALAATDVVSIADISANRLVFMPAPNANGTPYANFSFSVQDNFGGFDSTPNVFTLNVTAVNDAPTTTAVTLTAIAEDSGARVITQAELLANAADVDGPSLAATGLAISSGTGTLVDNGNGSWTYTPALNDDASVEFNYLVTDGIISVAGSATLDITPVNDAPVITSNGGGASAAVSVVENSTAVTTVTSTDVDRPAQTLTYSIVGGADAARFTIDATSGALRFISAPDFETPLDAGADNVYDVIVQVSDGSLTRSQAIAVTVLDVNEAPRAIDHAGSVAEGASTSVNLAAGASDPDAGPNGTLDLARTVIVTGPAHGSLVLRADGSVTYTHDGSETLDDSFTYTLRDAAGATSDVATVRLTVTPVNDAPTMVAATMSVQGGQSLVMNAAQLHATDVDNAAATLWFVVTEMRNGHFESTAAPGVALLQFTQADVAAGRVRFLSTSASDAPSFRIAAFDGQAYSAEISATIVFTRSAVSVVAMPTGEPPPPVVEPPPPPLAEVIAGTSRSSINAVSAANRDTGSADPAAPGRHETLGAQPVRLESLSSTSTARESGSAAANSRHGSDDRGGSERVGASLGPQGFNAFELTFGVPIDVDALGLLQIQALEAGLQARSSGALRTDTGGADATGNGNGSNGSENSLALTMMESAQVSGLALTAGTVWWALRAGGLLTGLMVSLPAWRHADLLAVLPDADADDGWDLAEDDEEARDERAVGALFGPEIDGAGR